MIRIAIATNRPVKACWSLMQCAPEDLPSWCALFASFDAMARIPDGCKVFGYWEEPALRASAEYLAFDIRKARGGFTHGLTADDFGQIAAWIARRDAAKAAELAEAVAALEAGIAKPEVTDGGGAADAKLPEARAAAAALLQHQDAVVKERWV